MSGDFSKESDIHNQKFSQEIHNWTKCFVLNNVKGSMWAIIILEGSKKTP